MAFRFSLDVVLRVRRGLERQRELALQAANHRVTTLARQLDDLRAEIAAGESRKARDLQCGLSAAELQFDLLCRSVLLQWQGGLQTQLTEMQRLRDSRAADFRQARQEREALEILRENQFSLYRQQEDRRGQRRLDDLLLSRRPRG